MGLVQRLTGGVVGLVRPLQLLQGGEGVCDLLPAPLKGNAHRLGVCVLTGLEARDVIVVFRAQLQKGVFLLQFPQL